MRRYYIATGRPGRLEITADKEIATKTFNRKEILKEYSK